VKFYRAVPLNAIPAGQANPGGAGPGGSAELGGVVIAIRLADLVSPVGLAAKAGRTALVVAGTPRIRAGEQLVFVKVAAVAPAVVRRDGKVQAGGHPADHARLGALEQQLDELAGPGVIDEIAAQAILEGKVKGKAVDDGRIGDPRDGLDGADAGRGHRGGHLTWLPERT
jgi:hypothetical protein